MTATAQGGLSLSQSFATTNGASYQVTFSMAGNPDGQPTVKTLSAYATSTDPTATSPAHSFKFDTTGKTESNMGWVTKSFTFVATGAHSTLTFASQDPGGYARPWTMSTWSPCPSRPRWPCAGRPPWSPPAWLLGDAGR